MVKIPSLSSRKVIRVLKKVGFTEDRQKGGHLVLINPKTKSRTIVPIHAGRDIKMPLVRAIINDTKLSVEEFLKLL